jgi:hypothetical protein
MTANNGKAWRLMRTIHANVCQIEDALLAKYQLDADLPP